MIVDLKVSSRMDDLKHSHLPFPFDGYIVKHLLSNKTYCLALSRRPRSLPW